MQDTGLVLLTISLVVAYVNWLPNLPDGPVASWLVPTSLIGGVMTLVVGVGLLIARAKLAAGYDRNATDPQTRIASGRLRALLTAELNE
jgi:hypothetical protein